VFEKIHLRKLNQKIIVKVVWQWLINDRVVVSLRNEID
jgi:regulator of protease activity HflC (stomatin/prohibitin superfamily)